VCSIGVTISQTGSMLSGSYGTTHGGGSMTGGISGETVTMSMAPTMPPGRAWKILAVLRDDQLNGSSDTYDPAIGSITLRRLGY